MPRRPDEVMIPAQTMQDLKVLRMTEIDMFFFLVAQERLQTQQLVTYLYRIKNFQIQDRYSCHHEVLQIARCIDKVSQSKKIMTFGKDYDLNEKQEINNQAWVLKVWDFESLCDGSYVWHNGLNGSTIWSKDYTGKSPFTIPIYVKEKPYLENVMYVKFSRDCAWAAVAF